MSDQDRLTEQFEAHRTHLRAVAYRMLGSVNEADDAVQEAWVRLSRADTRQVENLAGWLTTVVSRVCLDMLRSRGSRREHLVESAPEPVAGDRPDPEREAVLADSVGLALQVVLDTLTPPERLAFVLHDLFAVPFDEVAAIVGCTPVAARQHASRARRRVRGAGADAAATDAARERGIVDAFLAAARGGDFDALLALLAPDAVLRSDAAAVAAGAAAEVRGAAAVAQQFAGRAKVARPALIDGRPGAVWAQAGTVRVAFDFTITDAGIAGIELVMDSQSLDGMDVVLADGESGTSDA